MGAMAEFDLAVACCRWPPSPTRVRDAAEAGIDWDHFEKVVRRQRVEPIAFAALRQAEVEIPDSIASRLSAETDRTRRQNLVLAAECERLRRHLEAAAIPSLFVKGLTLAVLAYGGIGSKKGWDIDLLVEPEDVPRTSELLRTLGYRMISPPENAEPAQMAVWMKHMKEMLWTHGQNNAAIELHWSLTDNPRLMPELSTASPRQDVEIAPGIKLPTLQRDELFAYLCVHGGSSAWFRLKWVADLAALISGASDVEIERLHRRSIELGAGRASAAALLLIERLFDRPLPHALRRLRRNRINRLLVQLAVSRMQAARGAGEPTELRFGTVGIHASQLLIVPGFAGKVLELWRQLAAILQQRKLEGPR
jgi:hypothetical protein